MLSHACHPSTFIGCRELNIETEADWEEAKRLAIGAYKEWQQEQKAARRESGDSAKDMVAQREEIEAVRDSAMCNGLCCASAGGLRTMGSPGGC